LSVCKVLPHNRWNAHKGNVPPGAAQAHLIVQSYGALAAAPAGAPMGSLVLILTALAIAESDASRLVGTLPLVESSAALSPEKQLSDLETQELRALLQRVAPALSEARKLSQLPYGRYPPIKWPRSDLPHAESELVPRVAALLDLDVVLRAQDGEVDAALLSALGLINTARSVGDEPLAFSQLLRSEMRMKAVRAIERVLAQGQPSTPNLLDLQFMLEQEEVEPLLWWMARSDRAMWHHHLQAVKTGDMSLKQLAGPLWDSPLVNQFGRWTLTRSHAWILRFMNKYVEFAQMTKEEPEELELSLQDAPTLAQVLLRDYLRTIPRLIRSVDESRAMLRCAIVGIAVERYRIVHGRWPDGLAELVPIQLQKLPIDPFDREPLRYRQVEDGVVIYSVGQDKEDDGGKLRRRSSTDERTDLGFRLWDTSRRRQQPKEND
ncbi:MAG: hypothetical protein L0312_10130, partial [Acidobacteria bacterium]|nr:hypothetical protein [Acidobacteriota bacterium]